MKKYISDFNTFVNESMENNTGEQATESKYQEVFNLIGKEDVDAIQAMDVSTLNIDEEFMDNPKGYWVLIDEAIYVGDVRILDHLLKRDGLSDIDARTSLDECFNRGFFSEALTIMCNFPELMKDKQMYDKYIEVVSDRCDVVKGDDTDRGFKDEM